MSPRDIITSGSQLVWLVVSILLLVHLKVFDRGPVLRSPQRRSNLTMLSVAAVILLYLGVVVATQAGLVVFRGGLTGQGAGTQAAATGPASEPGVTTAPATMSATAPTTMATTEAATSPSSQAATEAATASATEPATQAVVVENTYLEMVGQLADAFTKAVPALLILVMCQRLVVGGIDGWGLSLRKIPAGVRLGMLGFLVLYPLLIVFNLLVTVVVHAFDKAHKDEIHPTLTLISQHGTPVYQQVVFVLVAGVFAPVLEEIFFRGLIQTALMERGWGFLPQENVEGGPSYRASTWHRWGAIVVSSAIFAGIHLMPESFVVLFVLALGLGYVYERTGNLWACIVLHGAFNCLNMYLFTRG